MKSLQQYIFEYIDAYRVTSLKAIYKVEPSEIILQAPESYDESNIQSYIGDKWLKDMPTSPEKSEKFFGNNKDHIYDVRFEYDTYEHLSIEPKDYIEWDSTHGSNNENDEKLEYFKLTNLKYIIEFDQFDLTNITEEDKVDQTIKDIFKNAESNNINKYPINIKFDEDALKYTK